MSTFVDATLLKLTTPSELVTLLVPPADAERRRVRTLLAAAYDLSLGTIHSIQDVAVRAANDRGEIIARRRNGHIVCAFGGEQVILGMW